MLYEAVLYIKRPFRETLKNQENQAVSVFVLFFVFSSLEHTVSVTVFLVVLPDCVCRLWRYEYNTHSSAKPVKVIDLPD